MYMNKQEYLLFHNSHAWMLYITKCVLNCGCTVIHIDIHRKLVNVAVSAK